MQQAPIDPLELAAQQLQAAVNQLATERHQRADPLASAVLDALEVWAQMAEQPGHPAQLAARQKLGRLVAVIDRARAVMAGIQIADQVPGGGNGRAERPHTG